MSMQVDLRRLQHPHRPSTAPIGNDRLMAALRFLARGHGEPLTVRKLLARSGADVCVTAADDAATQTAQWHTLLSQLHSPKAALIFHLENHYSVIYGARSWETVRRSGGDAVALRGPPRRGAVVRQVLVGKPGQQPSRWVPWEDVRACLLGWRGYAVMVVERCAEEVAVDKACERLPDLPPGTEGS